MDFKTSVKHVFNNYFTFSGRASRSEFWWWVLFTFLINIVLNIVNSEPLAILTVLALLIPNIAVTARRLHDIDKSGWWQLIMLIPIVGVFILIYWCIQKSTEGPNRFGVAAPTA